MGVEKEAEPGWEAEHEEAGGVEGVWKEETGWEGLGSWGVVGCRWGQGVEGCKWGQGVQREDGMHC